MKLRHTIADRVAGFVRDWSLPRQFAGEDPTREAAQSTMSRRLRPRLEEADTIGTSICPYCAVGCAQLVYAKDGQVIHIEGDPRSPINQGTWLTSPERLTKVLYRAPRLGDGPDRLSRQAHTGRDFCTRSARRHAGQSHAGDRLARGRYPRQ
jgi:Molybdopterin oxidoreductase Fe4S4 domain